LGLVLNLAGPRTGGTLEVVVRSSVRWEERALPPPPRYWGLPASLVPMVAGYEQPWGQWKGLPTPHRFWLLLVQKFWQVVSAGKPRTS
jgi:hypothetical protein